MLTRDLFDRQIEHLLSVRRYREATRLLLEKASSRHRGTLARILRQDLNADLEREVTKYVRELHAIGRDSVLDFTGAELDFQTNSLRRSVSDWFDVQMVSRTELVRRINATPIRLADSDVSHGTLTTGLAAAGNDELTRINRIIRRGITSGATPEELIEQVVRTSRLTETQAKTLVSTNMTAAENLISEAVYDANSDLLEGVMFTAILDSRTSEICGGRDGLFQAMDNIKVRPPLHWNCRSSLVPVLKSMSDLQASESARINQTALSRVDPSSLPGGLPPREGFDDWLRRQTMPTKLKYLGSEERVGLWSQGALTIKDFLSNLGAPIGTATLRVLDNQLTNWGLIRTTGGALSPTLLEVSSPTALTRSTRLHAALRDMFIADTRNTNSPLSLIDYRGTSIPGKRDSLRRYNNVYDERNHSFDPYTGESRSTLVYSQDHVVLRERLDYMRESKTLTPAQKDFISDFSDSLDGRVSVNQQTAIIENLRVVIERFNRDLLPWENFAAVLRAEMRFSVVNTSRILDRRSRARDTLFMKWTGDPDEPSVQISGQRVALSALHDEKLSLERFTRDWESKVGRNLARRAYYRFNAPWRTYFFRPEPKVSLAKKLKKYLKNAYPMLYRLFLAEPEGPTEALWSRLRRQVRESIRQILDLEFVYQKFRRNLLDRFLTDRLKDDEVIKVLSHMMKTVASGVVTDYDGLAITLGKELREQWPHRLPFMSDTLQDYHLEGSRFLQYFQRSGLIRVSSRGVVRRATLDLDTGRAGGAWKATVSREVEVIDPGLLELQFAARKLELSQRIGITHPSQQLYVRPGYKVYFDARGNKTGIPIVTRSAYANFDAKDIDRDFANMLNHTMSTKYRIDDQFVGFMDDLVRFKDSRGRAEYFDSINGFREEIIRRGDQGFGLMETLRYYRANQKDFSVLARIDGRGRVYYNGYLTPTGGEVVRPFLDSARGVPMSASGVKQLRIQVGSVIGPATEALTTSGRLAIFKKHENDILEIGRLISATTQRERRLREFLENPLIAEMSSEEIAKIARFSLEYYRLWVHTGGDIDNVARYSGFSTHLMGEADASASGLQVIALSTGNRAAAITSNILPTTSKQRIYDLVAQDVSSDPRFIKMMDELGLNLSWEDLSKAAKYQVMVTFYGAGQAGRTSIVTKELAKLLRKRDVIVTTRPEYLAVSNQIKAKIKEAKRLGADDVVEELRALDRSILNVVNNFDEPSTALLMEAEEFHPDAAALIQKYTNRMGAAVGPDTFKDIARLMTEKLAERAPVTSDFINFWKSIAQDYARATNRVDIPWVTLDGKTLWQRYRPKVQEEIRFRDPASGRYVRNIYQMDSPKDKLLGKAGVGDVRLGLGVNGNHMNDAAIVRRFHLWGRSTGVGTATIHDAVFMNINQIDQGIEALYEIYGAARDFDNIGATLRALRDAGLPSRLYYHYLQLAKEKGLMDTGFSSKDITAPAPAGYERYGWGP